MRAPVRISYAKGQFCLEAHLLIYGKKLEPSQIKYWARLVGQGIESKWQRSFHLTAEMQEVIRAYLLKHAPHELPSFNHDIAQKTQEAERLYTKQLAKDLRTALTKLQARQAISPLKSWQTDKTLLTMQLTVRITREDYRGKVPILRFFRRLIEGGRRPLLIYLKKLGKFPAHVRSSLWRRVWGILRDGQAISLGFNWHPLFPGLVYLPTDKSPTRLQQLAAHEFGHNMGLGDAYAAWYRCYDEYPDSKQYLMNSNRKLSEEEILMMFRARTVGKLQHFPYKKSIKQFIRGLRKEIKYYATLLNKEKN